MRTTMRTRMTTRPMRPNRDMVRAFFGHIRAFLGPTFDAGHMVSTLGPCDYIHLSRVLFLSRKKMTSTRICDASNVLLWVEAKKQAVQLGASSRIAIMQAFDSNPNFPLTVAELEQTKGPRMYNAEQIKKLIERKKESAPSDALPIAFECEKKSAPSDALPVATMCEKKSAPSDALPLATPAFAEVPIAGEFLMARISQTGLVHACEIATKTWRDDIVSSFKARVGTLLSSKNVDEVGRGIVVLVASFAESSKSLYSELLSSVGELEKVKMEAEKVQKEAEDVKEQLEKAKEEAKTELEKVRKEAEDVKIELEKVRKEAEDAKKDLEKVQKEAEDVKEQMEMTRMAAAEIRKEFDELLSQNDAATTLLDQLTQENIGLKNSAAVATVAASCSCGAAAKLKLIADLASGKMMV